MRESRMPRLIGRVVFASWLGLAVALSGATGARADEARLVAEAAALYNGPETTLENLQTIRGILDRIVAEHPASPVAADVMFGNPVGGIDLAALDARLRQDRVARSAALALAVPPKVADKTVGTGAQSGSLPAPQLAVPQVTAAPVQLAPAAPPVADAAAAPLVAPPHLVPATEQSEAAMALDKLAIRDIQARLLVLGFDPNGIDGSIGRGTRAAISAWQASAAVPVSGFIDVAQRQFLTSASQAALSEWLISVKNQQLYNPPPPIPLTAENLSGTWSSAVSCGAKSRAPGRKVTEAMNIRVDANGWFSGTIRNSQGFNGTINGRMEGRSVTGRVDMGLLVGNATFTGRVKDDALVIVGRDSHGCDFTARKD